MGTYLVVCIAVALALVYVTEVILMARSMRRKIIKILRESPEPLNSIEIFQKIEASQKYFGVSRGSYYRSLCWLDKKAIITSTRKLDSKKRSQQYYSLVERDKTTSTP